MDERTNTMVDYMLINKMHKASEFCYVLKEISHHCCCKHLTSRALPTHDLLAKLIIIIIIIMIVIIYYTLG